MTDTDLPSIDTLRKLLRLDPESGELFWLPRDLSEFPRVTRGSTRCLIRSWNNRYAGQQTFQQMNKKGYLVGKLKGKFASAHRVVWAMYHGEWPTGQIDHINGDKTDNRPCNLREVSNLENCRNKPARRSRNRPGAMGVHLCQNGTWQAAIGVAGKQMHLGTFATEAEAFAARKAAEIRHGFHPNHGRTQ